MPGEQVVVRLEVNAALDRGGIWRSALERHHGLDVKTHQLPVQVLQAPVIWTHTRTRGPRAFVTGMRGKMSGAAMG